MAGMNPEQSNRFTLHTPRMTLLAGTLEHAQAAVAGNEQLAKALDAKVTDEWPDPLLATALPSIVEWLRSSAPPPGWAMWYFLLRQPGGYTLAGCGGFKGAPEDGVVEVGYSVLPEFQRRGLATEVVHALLAWAFEQPGVRTVIAHTYHDLPGSLGVLRNTGFRPAGEGPVDDDRPGVPTLRFEIDRPA